MGRQAGAWRDGTGKSLALLPDLEELTENLHTKRVVLATAHRDHNTGTNADANFITLCQRCHINHDRPEHKRTRWRTLFRRRADGDLFG